MFSISTFPGAERGAAGSFCDEAMATRQSPAHCGHSWQKIKGTDYIGEENGVEWLEVCIHCDARRRMGKRPNGWARALGTEPACRGSASEGNGRRV